MAFKLGMLGKILLVLGVLVVLAVCTVVWLVWKRPLTVDAWVSRMALGKAGLTETTLQSPAGPMTVWEGGSGPPMVLLHGAGDQAGAWARIVPSLTSEYRLLIPDLPGHWKSAPTKGPLQVATVLAGVEALMDARCADEPAILVGNSLGGWMAMLYARDNPAGVARVVAVNGGALKQENPKVNLFPTTREEAQKTMAGLTGPASMPVPGIVLDDVVRHARVGPAARLAQTADQMEEFLLDGRLHEVQVPVELVWGDADQLLDLDYAQRLLDGLPRARLFPVKGCGHIPHRECPDRLLKALREALAQPPAEAGAADTSEEQPDAEVP